MPGQNELELDAEWLKRLRANLKRWYARHARDLPWRRTQEPYRIWISEIMLQQTTVTAVIPYFERFMARFPTIHELAAADEDEVLRHWEGLGYYSRARNIHKTARLLVDDRDGNFPSEVPSLHALPGIGRYTAGAIASFGFGTRAPILEANTLRLYTRLLGYDDDPRNAAGQRLLWEFAERILPRKEIGPFNQALMELGGTLCSITAPACKTCPVRSCCRAFAEGRQAEIPQPKRRPEITDVTEVAVAIRDRQGRYLIERRPPGVRWAGLWDFFRFEVATGVPFDEQLRGHIEQLVRERIGLDVQIRSQFAEFRHSVTRYRIQLKCLDAEWDGRGLSDAAEERRRVPPSAFTELALSTTGRKIAKLLVDNDL